MASKTPEIPESHPNLAQQAQSPLKPVVWATALKTHPDPTLAYYITEGIKHGFRIGYDYSNHSCNHAHGNLPGAKDHPDIISKYLSDELSKGRMLGPFPVGAIPGIQISRIGVIPKKSTPGKWRLITDLSFPPGKSVNDGIASDMVSLKYIKVEEIANRVALLGKGSLLAKMDVQEAYRLVPIHNNDKHLLGISSEGQVYIDIALPFGLRSAPLIFTAIADGVQWILEQRGVSDVSHYLDDFITIGPPSTIQCATNQNIITDTCKELGIPLAPHKSVGPTTCLVFLGIEIDTIAMELRLPADKLSNLKLLLAEWQFKKVCTREKLESLLGHLNHACSVVRPGRSFIRRLICLLTEAKRKHRYIIRINVDARSDIRWWHTFAASWNGVSIIKNPPSSHPNHEMWSDASGSWGAGAFWESEWLQFPWPDALKHQQIAIKELIPIVLACALWGKRWKGATVRANCDNDAVVAVINSGYSKEPFLVHLLRTIFFLSAKFDFSLVAAHIPGHLNVLANAISRDNASLFLSSYTQVTLQPTFIPDNMVQVLLIEKADWTSNSWMLWPL